MSEKEFLENQQKHLDALIETLKKELALIRTNRPSPALVEDIKVECYGQKLSIKQLGTISVVPPREIQIQLWDANIAKDVLKAIDSTNRGFSTALGSKMVKVFLPELSQERRQEFIKTAKQIGEEFKIQIRRWRDEANKTIADFFEKGEISEDMKFKLKEQVQKKIDEANKNLEKILSDKINEINI